MKTREELRKEWDKGAGFFGAMDISVDNAAKLDILFEVLLDIRELLVNSEDAVAQVKQAIYDRRLQ